MRYALSQRIAFSDALLEVGADAPTLCEGWDAFDLAAHCWVRERSPKALLGIASNRLSRFADDAMIRAKESMGFVEMATRLRETPRTPVTVIPGGDDAVNMAEYLIHTEDVRRANGLPLREIGDDVQVQLWRKLPLIGKVFFRPAPDGIVLEWPGTDADPIRIKPGTQTVTLQGAPSECLLFAFGRGAVADVNLIGTPEAVAELKLADLGA